MKRRMEWLAATTLSALLLLAAPALSQGRGGGGGQPAGGGTGPADHGQQGRYRSQSEPRGQGQTSVTREHLMVSEQQRTRARDCGAIAGQARRQAHDMSRHSNRGFDRDAALRQRDQLRRDLATMYREHDGFVGSLGDRNRQMLGERTQELNRIRDQIDGRMKATEAVLSRGDVDQRRLTQETRELERQLKAWQRQYRKIASQLEITHGQPGKPY